MSQDPCKESQYNHDMVANAVGGMVLSRLALVAAVAVAGVYFIGPMFIPGALVAEAVRRQVKASYNKRHPYRL